MIEHTHGAWGSAMDVCTAKPDSETTSMIGTDVSTIME
jgi:hypothetical protein